MGIPILPCQKMNNILLNLCEMDNLSIGTILLMKDYNFILKHGQIKSRPNDKLIMIIQPRKVSEYKCI